MLPGGSTDPEWIQEIHDDAHRGAADSSQAAKEASGQSSEVWYDDEKGLYNAPGGLDVFHKGPIKGHLVFEDKGYELNITKMEISHQSIDFAKRFVKVLRDQGLRPDRPVLMNVHYTQPALLEALKKLPTLVVTMGKRIDMSMRPPSPKLCPGYKMENPQASLFLSAREKHSATWLKELAIGPETDEYASAVARAYFEEVLPFGASTSNQYFFNFDFKYRKDSLGERVGSLWLEIAKRENGKKICRCHHVEIRPEKRRMGFGTQVLTYLDGLACRSGCEELWIDILGENEAAEKLCRRRGYIVVERLFFMKYNGD